jgi:hypothetical protein
MNTELLRKLAKAIDPRRMHYDPSDLGILVDTQNKAVLWLDNDSGETCMNYFRVTEDNEIIIDPMPSFTFEQIDFFAK